MPVYALNSGVLFSIARTACKRAGEARDDTIVAIVFAVAGLESFLNEVLEHLRRDRTPALQQVKAIVEASDLYERNATLPLKVQLLSAALSGEALDRGAQPYQDFDLLLAIRNTVVHQRPELLPKSGGVPADHQHLLKRLITRGLLPADSFGVVRVTFGELSDPRIGQWAFEAALQMVKAVAELLPGDVGARWLLTYRALGFIQ